MKPFCSDCPDHEACATGATCTQVRQINPRLMEGERYWPDQLLLIIDARKADATTCPSCRVAVPLGQYCKCPMRWKG